MRASRRLRIAFALALLLSGAAFATAPTPMLWKASKGGTTIYLLGSLHILLASDYPLSKDVDDAYRHASRVVFEVPPADMSPLAALGPTSEYGMYLDPSQSLQGDLDPAVWQRMAAYASQNGLPEAVIERMRPWLAAITILGLELQKLGYDPNAGLDKHFMDQAAADHKATNGFETIEQQMQILASTSRADQAHDLTEMLDEVPDFASEMRHLHDAWRSGDTVVMYDEEIKEFKGHPEEQHKLLEDRNRAWIPKLEQIATTGPGDTLVIVGALHLLGPEGLVRLLEHDGYTLERVCTGCGKLR
ncbi:MAG TPA: TraB/GumN family protein [Xanthomonadaceae bacterium]|jgi:uncharacterized protein YbaP (TraB family)|nr:TraB/GumN family protein [Xanthomonadaceae bacterium]